MKDTLTVGDVVMLLPADLHLERNGERISAAELSDAQIYALAASFQSLLLTLRDRASMH